MNEFCNTQRFQESISEYRLEEIYDNLLHDCKKLKSVPLISKKGRYTVVGGH